jgi:hypothetical protein
MHSFRSVVLVLVLLGFCTSSRFVAEDEHSADVPSSYAIKNETTTTTTTTRHFRDVRFLGKTYNHHLWSKYQSHLNDLFRDGKWEYAWDREDYKPLYSYPCRWNNGWFNKFVDINVVDVTSMAIICWNSMPSQGYKYLWTPEKDSLALFSTRKMCEIMHGRNFLIVGDSLQEELFFTTLSALRSRTIVTSKNTAEDVERKREHNHERCANFCMDPKNSDSLCKEEQVIDCGDDLPSFNLSFYRDNVLHQSADGWMGWIQPRNISLLLFNHGPHFSGATAVEDAQFKTLSVLQYMEEHHPDVSILWRTSARGHKNAIDAFKRMPADSVPEDPDVFSMYNWNQLSDMNTLTERMIRERFPGILVVDVSKSTEMRWDTHSDGMHYCMPGPQDSWLLFLFNALLRLPSDAEVKGVEGLGNGHEGVVVAEIGPGTGTGTGTGIETEQEAVTIVAGTTGASRKQEDAHPVEHRHGDKLWKRGENLYYRDTTPAGVEVWEVETFQAIVPDSTLVMSNKNLQNAVFVVLNGTRHVFPDGDTLLSMGYDFGRIQKKDVWEIYAIPLGRPLDQIWTRRARLTEVGTGSGRRDWKPEY